MVGWNLSQGCSNYVNLKNMSSGLKFKGGSLGLKTEKSLAKCYSYLTVIDSAVIKIANVLQSKPKFAVMT